MLALGVLGGCGSDAASHESTGESGPRALSFPSGPAPKKVVVKDLKVGKGPPLKPGDYISVNYIAYDYDTHEALEKHWGPEDTFGGTWGRDAGLIRAWEIGLRGMRVGGERELITPGKFVHGGLARVYLMKMVEIIRVKDLVEEITEESPAGSDEPPDWTPIEKVAGNKSDLLLIPHGPPPKKVVIRDLRIGTGPVLKPGETFSPKYVVQNYRTGEVREDRWNSDTPSVYAYDEEAMVDGWVPGLRGVRYGGKRELIVPGSLAYGNPLVYVVEVLPPKNP